MSQDFLDSNVGAATIGVLGSLLGATLGLFGERWVRTWGGMECKVAWRAMSGAGSAPNYRALQRELDATFLNRKDIEVIVWSMTVEFYKGDDLPPEPARPNIQSAQSLELFPLPPRDPVTRTISMSVLHEPERQKWVEEADRVEFVANIEGVKEIRMRLNPWNDPTPQTSRWRRRWWEFWR